MSTPKGDALIHPLEDYPQWDEVDEADEALADVKDFLRGRKFNPNHEPPGSPEGGRFASAPGGPADVSLPRVPSGHVRLYRGMGSADRVPDPDKMDRNGEPTRGRFFTTSRGWAEQYGRRRAVAYVDVPEDAIAEHLFYRNTTTGYEEYTLPEHLLGGLRVYWRAPQSHEREALLASLGITPEDLKYKALPDDLAWLLEDNTWRDLRDLLVPIVRPVFTEAFMVGAQLATQQKPGKRGRRDNPNHEPAGSPIGGQFASAPGGGELGDEFVQKEFPAHKAVFVRPDGAYVVAPGELEHMQFGARLNGEGTGFSDLHRKQGWVTLRAGLYRKNDLSVSVEKEPTAAQMRAIEAAAVDRKIDYSIGGTPNGRYHSGQQTSYASFKRDVLDAFAGREQSLLQQFRSLDTADLLDFMRGRKAPPISLLDAGLGLPWLPFDFDAVLGASQEIISLYTDLWWLQFTQSTQNALRAIIARAEAESLSMPEIIDLVTPLFGPQRARAIAVTETTRLLGLGAQETYKRAGFSMWEWRTVRDARVDPDCVTLGGVDANPPTEPARFPMTTPFIPAHVNCRCWPVPYGDPTAPSAMIPFDPAAIGTGSNFVA